MPLWNIIYRLSEDYYCLTISQTSNTIFSLVQITISLSLLSFYFRHVWIHISWNTHVNPKPNSLHQHLRFFRSVSHHLRLISYVPTFAHSLALLPKTTFRLHHANALRAQFPRSLSRSPFKTALPKACERAPFAVCPVAIRRYRCTGSRTANRCPFSWPAT